MPPRVERREAPTRTAGDEPPWHFRRGRRPLGFGEARRRRRGRRRHGRGGSASSARRIGLILEPTIEKHGLNSENIMTATKPKGNVLSSGASLRRFCFESNQRTTSACSKRTSL